MPDIQVEESEGEGGKKQRSVYIQNGLEATLYVIAPREGAGSTSDAGPDVDTRGDSSAGDSGAGEAGADDSGGATDSGVLGFGIGLADGVGNTGYLASGGAATFVFGPMAGAGFVIGYWASGGNPASEARQFVGELIGSELLSTDPSGATYTAGMITGEVVSGGLGGAARGIGSGVRSLVVLAARRCVGGACGRAGKGFAGRLVDLATGAKCFVAGTLVETPAGPQPIESLEVGDLVWAGELVDNELVLMPRRVLAVHERHASERLRLHYRSASGELGTLELTPEHPLFDAQFGRYVRAEDLDPGTRLVLDDGELAVIEGREHIAGEVAVYNLEVEVSHNYFAGDPAGFGAILVHNGKYPGAKRGPKTDPTAPHNAKIRAEADILESEGNRILHGGGRGREKLVKTTGGVKSGRRPDITYITPDGQVRGRNVGRTYADGSPVRREAEALQDLNGPGNLPTDFVPYDR